jgi:hypothetical protein
MVPFQCEAFPSVGTQSAPVVINVNHKLDDHEGFFFFMEPLNAEKFEIIRKITIQNYGSAFLTVYGYTDEKQLSNLMPYYELNSTAKRLNESKKEMSLSVYGSTYHSMVSFAETVRKTWNVLVPDTQVLLPKHYQSRESSMWQKRRTFELPNSVIAAQKSLPLLGLYVECKPLYNVSVAVVGLGGVELSG